MLSNSAVAELRGGFVLGLPSDFLVALCEAGLWCLYLVSVPPDAGVRGAQLSFFFWRFGQLYSVGRGNSPH